MPQTPHSTHTTVTLITGASSGLGAAFAAECARSGHRIVLVSPETDRLTALAPQLETLGAAATELLVADLTSAAGLERVEARLTAVEHPVSLLINCAGFGLRESFERNTIEAEEQHLAIHVTAPMRLMHAALGPMLRRGEGRILNIASIGAFLPRSSYGAAKAWIVSFSRWAHLHYRPSGVRVTVLCPGFLRTEFQQRMGLSTEQIPNWMWLNPEYVARIALADNARGRGLSVPSIRYRVLLGLLRIVPAGLANRSGNRGRYDQQPR